MSGDGAKALYGYDDACGVFADSAIGFGLALTAALPLLEAAGCRVSRRPGKPGYTYRFERKDWKGTCPGSSTGRAAES